MPRGIDGPLSLAALYNKVSSDDPAAARETFSGTVGHLLARNVRAVAEAGRDIEHEAWRISVGFVSGF